MSPNRTGWPPGLLQDDSRELSSWFSSRLGAKHQVDKVCAELRNQRTKTTMNTFRVETVNGRHLLCGGLLKTEDIKPGQRWAPASGGNYEAEILKIEDNWVVYHYPDNTKPAQLVKDAFAFQCRYCLVLPTEQVPPHLN